MLRSALLVGTALAGALGAPAALFARGGSQNPSPSVASLTTSTAPAPVTTSTTSVTTTTTTSTVASSDPCLQSAARLRCPDLVMSAPSEVRVDRTTRAGHTLLRATSSVNNVGEGPIELRARRGRSGAWVVYQAIYDHRGHAHLFRTHVQLVYKHIPGDRYEYGNVGAASYWKVRHLAAFQLWALDAGGNLTRLVRTGPKVDYCLRDLTRTHPSSRSPRSPVYGGCSTEYDIRQDIFGTSVGWSDVYPYAYPEQWIDVTGLHGRFAFVQIANPEDLWSESSLANNASMTFVSLPRGRVLGRETGVPAP